MQPRRLGVAERLTRASDELYTMNFVTVASVRASFDEEALRTALRAMVERHPLLGCSIRRRGLALTFIPGQAMPLGLEITDEPGANIIEATERLLRHESWPADGPRGKLRCLRHGPEHSTLLWCHHHVVGDGSSGVLVMRDLIEWLAGELESTAELPAPPQEAVHPRAWTAGARRKEALAFALEELSAKTPRRLVAAHDVPPERRANRVGLLRFPVEAVKATARSARATLHGVLCAAAIRAFRRKLGMNGELCLMHPVDMRRLIATLTHDPRPRGPIGDAVGCYVSFVQTRHRAEQGRTLADDAREISEAVRELKARAVPFLTSPWLGRVLLLLSALIPRRFLLPLCERLLSANTFVMTNLGALEDLGVRERVGPIAVDDFYFVASPSISAQLGAAASTFRGQLTLATLAVEPCVSAEQLAWLNRELEQELTGKGE